MKINEKAVSEAVGFVLILGIVISGIGLVTLYGYPVLLKEQSNTDVKNMERAMIVIQNDMKSLCYKNVPYKETSLQVSGGTLEVINSGDYGGFINVTNGTPSLQQDYSLGALIYRSDRSTEVITLENGAVMTCQEGSAGSAMLAEPRWFYDGPTGTFVIYIMNISTDDLMAKSGMGAVRMSLENVDTQVYTSPNDVTVTYTPDGDNDLTVAWDNYLTGIGPSGTHTLLGVNKLVIKEYRIKIYDI
ncbi:MULTISPECIES: DUF7289 family protein [unclassified Methanoculleus]|uniref:DUF7289 family protein n=1 Tax=unclassified Methanoculleus TaxID=2619537 RepID=UPI0025F4CB4C|nr:MULTISPECIES: hypothetical protein [unclassified Methanoculleus]